MAQEWKGNIIFLQFVLKSFNLTLCLAQKVKGNPYFLQFMLKFFNLDLCLAQKWKGIPILYSLCWTKIYLDLRLVRQAKGNPNFFIVFSWKSLFGSIFGPRMEGEFYFFYSLCWIFLIWIYVWPNKWRVILFFTVYVEYFKFGSIFGPTSEGGSYVLTAGWPLVREIREKSENSIS